MKYATDKNGLIILECSGDYTAIYKYNNYRPYNDHLSRLTSDPRNIGDAKLLNQFINNLIAFKNN